MPLITVSLIFFAFVFFTAFLAVWVTSRLMPALGPAAPGEDPGSALFRDDSPSSISLLAKILERLDIIDRLEVILAQANVAWSPGRVVLVTLLAGTIGLVLSVNLSFLPLAFSLLLTAGCAALPVIYLLRIRRKRLARFEAEFPEALDSMCRALRAGHPFAAAVETLTADATGPVAAEMRKTIDEWRLGAHWDTALGNLAERIPLIDVRVFTAAVRLQMRTGGRLGEVLTRLAESMRENVAIRGEVSALAAHGRATGMVLTLLPIAIAAIMFSISPAPLQLLANHPLGSTLIGTAIAMLVVAHFVIKKIVDIRI